MKLEELEEDLKDRNVLQTLETLYTRLHLEAKPEANPQVFVNGNIIAIKTSRYKEKNIFPNNYNFSELKKIHYNEYEKILNCFFNIINNPKIPISFI